MRHTIILITLFLILSCKKSDDNNYVAAQQTGSSVWSFSAEVDGDLINADSAKGSLHIDTSFGVPIRSFIIAGYCPGKIIYPGFTDTINTLMLFAQNYDSVPATDVALDFYPLNDTINEFSSIASSFIITSVDTLNKKVSGNFSGVVVGDVTSDTIDVAHGIFTNIPYEIW